MYTGDITDLSGITVGVAQDTEKQTGCTAVLFDHSVTAGVDVRGGGPGTISTDILSPTTGGCMADCFMLSGGSSFGLASIAGAMRYLRERGRGFPTGICNVPIVPGAILFDLGIGDAQAYPDADMGYAAVSACRKGTPQGSFGAGTGATVGKILRGRGMEKCGQGTASIPLGDGILVGAVFAVNALGDVVENGRIISGLHTEGGEYPGTLNLMLAGQPADVFGQNTTIGVVATNAALSPAMATKMAQVAHDGLAMAISPVHTLADGDTIFAAATGEIQTPVEPNRIFAAAAEAARRAIINAALASKASAILP